MSRNIKEIGKELLGKSLNSYHRRTGLTQLEKNNEMQDGILNGILSQVDDAYIEKTEQSNVIHLDGSGDGVVVLDGIEGNTMVNIVKSYDNSKFSYSHSQKLDNNYFKLQHSANENSSSVKVKYGNHIYKPNTTYTLIVDIKENTSNAKLGVSGISSVITKFSSINFSNLLGQSMITFVTKDDFSTDTRGENPPTLDLYFCSWDKGGDLSNHITFRYWILEGDWTNKEISPYFEGLQSSFEEQLENDKYKIEILSNNKNLINNNESYQSSYASWMPNIGSLNNVIKTDTYNATFNNRGVGFLVKDLKPNTQYTLSIPSLLTNNKLCYALYSDENSINSWQTHIQGQGNISDNKITFTTPNRKTVAVVGVYGSYDVLYNNGANDGTVVIGNYRKLQLEVGSKNTEFNLQKQNKIKLLINEPLRGIGNVKDKLCIKDNKLMVKRFYKEVILNGTENWSTWSSQNNETTLAFYCQRDMQQLANLSGIMCDNFIVQDVAGKTIDCIDAVKTHYLPRLRISKSKLNTQDINGLKQWLQNNPTKLVFQTIEPFYEEVLNEYGEPIILEGYENGTIYIDSTIVPTTTVRYTPKMESFKTLKEVNNNNIMLTNDVNDNIIPYMMDVDLMIMEKEMALMSHKNIRTIGAKDMTSMQKRTQDMLERLIKGKTLTEQECKTRVAVYLNAGKITDEQAKELNFLIDEIYA